MQELETREMRDITPTPRILRTLGEIPFAPWQCIAELVDNALDMASRGGAGALAAGGGKKRVIVSWSGESVAAGDRQLEVLDTGPGLTLDAIQDSVRAGFTSNDPLDNLGLFGMGFNIATARLGEKTLFLSATADAPEYVGISIDFAELTRSGVFKAPVVTVPKQRKDEHGTKVIVQKLKPSIYASLRNSVSQIREILSDIYAPILEQGDVEVMVKSHVLGARRHCVWDAKRYVTVARGGVNIPARVDIDEVFGEALFDSERNRYLSLEEEEEALRYELQNGSLPPRIVSRAKRVSGWLGVQRYPDPDDFGIDFIRNGRKILRRDKSLFYFENPLTGNRELEYPVELGATVGGRVVGEIHVDHVPPTYQKNDFDRTDASWHEVVEALRGAGPIRPNNRKAHGYTDDNNSPLGRLVRGYGVVDAGTKHLVAAPHHEARNWAKKFREGDPDYQADDKWWEAAREADRVRADKGKGQKADPGRRSSDDTSIYTSGGGDGAPAGAGGEATTASSGNGAAGVAGGGATLVIGGAAAAPEPQRDPVEDLRARSARSVVDSRDYTYPEGRAPFAVTVWELNSGKIGEGEDGDPCHFHKDGHRVEFFYNPRHPFLRDYHVTHRDLLLIGLAERFQIRDSLPGGGAWKLFTGLVTENFPDSRVDVGRMQEAANTFFNTLKERAIELLSLREQEVMDHVHEAVGEVEEIANSLLSNTDLLRRFQSRDVGSINALAVAPARTMVRLVDRFPEEFFDGKFFRMPYMDINLPDPNSTERLRGESKERLLSFLKDALWVISESRSPARQQKAELARCLHSLNILEQETEL
ncbi:MAG: ATP-binding protein [Acidobacteria bacterium]|nr:ATP-binding protein [Acidobacteriota bacterium]